MGAAESRDRRHFLPASSIGYFSSMASTEIPKGKRRRRRNRPIWVLRKGQLEPRQDIPNNVAHSRDVYHPGMGPMFDVDKFFSSFEAMNDDAVTGFLAESTPEKTFNVWVRLAAYIAARITRNPDAEFAMAADDNFSWSRETSGIGYQMNMQRTCAAVLRTRWDLIVCRDADFVINDRGFAGILDPVWRGPALLVPLRKDTAALLGSGKPFQKPITWDGSAWKIRIPTRVASNDLLRKYNALSWWGAREEIYGSSAEGLRAAAALYSDVPEPVKSLARGDAMFNILGVGLEQRMRDEQLLYNFLGGWADPEPGSTPPTYLA